MTRNIALLGGAGFIGRRLEKYLKSQGEEVFVLDIKPDPLFDKDVQYDVRIYDPEPLSEVDVIYLLAAEHADDIRPVSRYYETNVGGAENVVKVAAEQNIKTIIFTSSVAVYGLNSPGANEERFINPSNDYGKSKAAAEQVLKAWAQEDKTRSLVVIRPCVVFGEQNRGNVFNLMRQIHTKKFIRVGKGHNKKSMAYVGNIAEFLSYVKDMGPGIHLFNYADKPDMTIDEIVQCIADEMGVVLPRISIPKIVAKFGASFLDTLSSLVGINFPISGERIHKYTSDTSVETERMQATGFEPTDTLNTALRATIRAEFNGK